MTVQFPAADPAAAPGGATVAEPRQVDPTNHEENEFAMNFTPFRRFLAAFASVLATAPVLAWGPEGHSIVAEIAQRRLSPAASAAVAELVGPRVSLASLASWADDERTRRPQTAHWHFVDIPLDAREYDEARDCRPNAEHGDCIVRELERLRTEMRCAPTVAGRRDALRFAVHFVGDIHQPMHAVGDRMGGNHLSVHGEIHGATCRNHCELGPDSANLHVIWDSTLIRRTVWAWGSYVERLEDGVLRSGSLEASAGGTPAEWAQQSHAVAREVWRARPGEAQADLDDAYYEQVLPVLDRQLALGGLRLAAYLNAAFDPAAACPAR
jgi:hypothetical protein